MIEPIRLSIPAEEALTEDQSKLYKQYRKLISAEQQLMDLTSLALVLKRFGEGLENSSPPQAEGLAGTANLLSYQISEAEWVVNQAIELFRPLVIEALGNPKEIKPIKAA